MRWMEIWVAGAILVGMGCGDDSAPVDGGITVICVTDSDCDDGVFCNGEATCDPSSPSASADGCVPGARPCAEGVMCVEAEARCDDEADCDRDMDGVQSIACGGTDCDDDDPNRYPGNEEVCDSAGHDEDCVPTTFGQDTDEDGYEAAACCNGDECGTDCDDTRAGVNPGASDGCGGGDEDCDGATDEEPDTTYYLDADEDNYGTPDVTVMACAPPTGYVNRGDDCDDDDFDIHPGVAEPCDMVDNDCDGTVDEQPLDQPICCFDNTLDCDGDRLDCEADADSDPMNCGGCGLMCDGPTSGNGVAACAEGGCLLDCDTGFTSCGLDCVDVTSDSNNCGSCGMACDPFPNATTACTDSVCSFGGCDTGYGNCDGSEANGCETPLGTEANCLSCGDSCSTSETCTAGGCAPT